MAQVRRIYYGWVLVGVAFITGGFNTGVGTWALTVFAKPMTDELGWSRTTFFVALTIYTALPGFLSPLIGPYRDTTRGPRLLMLGGSIILGLALMSLRWVDSLWQYYLFFGIVGSVGSMGLGETMTQVILPKWFIRKRGKALGIAVMGGGMGPLLAPITLYALISTIGWRDTWFVMGLAVIVVLVPLSFLIQTRSSVTPYPRTSLLSLQRDQPLSQVVLFLHHSLHYPLRHSSRRPQTPHQLFFQNSRSLFSR